MRRLTKTVVALVAAAGLAIGLSACGDTVPEAQKAEQRTQQSSYERLSAQQPAKAMGFSPTRETIKFWINTWDEPGKLSYVYLLASNGQLVGYYILEGPPVSSCAALTPTERVYIHEYGNYQSNAPSVDGVFYSGGQCSSYYGKDASSGTYIEYSIGGGLNHLIYSEPLPRQDVEPLGFATVENVK